MSAKSDISSSNSSENFDARILQALSALCRILNHKLRSPLSVITNELSYLQKVNTPDEPLRSPERCREVVKILDSLSWIGVSNVDFEQVTFSDFAALIAEKSGTKVEHDPAGPQSTVNISKRLIGGALAGLVSSAVLDSLPGTKLFKIFLVQNYAESGGCRWLVSLQFETAAGMSKDSCRKSLTQLFCLERNLELPVIPLIDAVFLAHGCDIEVTHRELFEINVSFQAQHGRTGVTSGR